ncbi:MAG: hypothetical protein HPY79_07570 [Bacteroidales bacterium]|nr:hypothetical protein [Bacteroidales bacterium]
MKKLFVIVIVAVFAFSSCGKYEEGPAFSLASKKSRVVNTWVLDKEFVNGQEVTLTADQKDDYIEFTKDDKVKITYVSGSQSTTVEGTWEFDDKKEHLIIKFSYTYLGQTITETQTAKILRLKSNEMWLEEQDGNDTYKYYYVSK